MMKILIVDDEYIARAGIRTIIERSGYDWEIIGEATDGIDAKEKLESELPDVVMTDIRMPEMDGIELMRHIKNTFSQILVVIISGYAEFSYAQQAIQMGAFDYVLKPINPDHLTQVLLKTEKVIKEREQKKEEQERILQEIKQTKEMLKEKLLRDLLYGVVESRSLSRLNDLFRGKWAHYTVILIRIYSEHDDFGKLWFENKSPCDDEIRRIIGETQREPYQQIVLSCEEGLFALILYSDKPDIPINRVDISDICKSIQINLKEKLGLIPIMGISRIYKGMEDLPLAFKEGIMCIRNCLLSNVSMICFANELIENQAALSHSNIYPYDIEAKILSALKVGRSEDVNLLLVEFFDRLLLSGGQEREIDKIRKACNDLFLIVSRSLFQDNMVNKEVLASLMDSMKEVVLLDDVEDLINWSKTMMDKICTYIHQNKKKQHKKVIEIAVNYIRQHYTEDLTLKRMGEVVYMNPNYFCDLFKQEMGQSFSEFVANLRIERAKELLQSRVDLKCYEIASMVGYKDPKYFSHVFKKLVGVTPSEYRDGKAGL